ncbi:unnamed protein product [Vitrella brassicaformis CCMP3155]|uniref:Protein kinase domain-containing protein n=1 Tax=Vitrella brassicaformis (strain CCMP3155) TaxID=1169540 RepID=A0A0G4FDX0_VITBC|nr:unnamed protein product [Vitrella brassicaformis CCMP3155]|eukprot:CEM11402.1 unnamed protein product [Vitrella brassicaformis CCMP3155]
MQDLERVNKTEKAIRKHNEELRKKIEEMSEEMKTEVSVMPNLGVLTEEQVKTSIGNHVVSFRNLPDVTDEEIDFYFRGLMPDPNRRPSASELLAHDWFAPPPPPPPPPAPVSVADIPMAPPPNNERRQRRADWVICCCRTVAKTSPRKQHAIPMAHPPRNSRTSPSKGSGGFRRWMTTEWLTVTSSPKRRSALRRRRPLCSADTYTTDRSLHFILVGFVCCHETLQ